MGPLKRTNAGTQSAMAVSSLLPTLAPGRASAPTSYRDGQQAEELKSMLSAGSASAPKPYGRWGQVPAEARPAEAPKPADPPHDETIFEYYTGLPDRYRVNAINAIAGWQDTLTFGLAEDIRKATGLNKDVDHDTAAYGVGEVAGVGTSLLFGGEQGIKWAGTKAKGMEFSHWIPNRMGGPRSIWNGNYVTKEEHALSDPYRYRFMKKVWKELNPMPNRVVQQWVRVPKVYKGGAAGAGSGAVGAAYSRSKGE